MNSTIKLALTTQLIISTATLAVASSQQPAADACSAANVQKMTIRRDALYEESRLLEIRLGQRIREGKTVSPAQRHQPLRAKVQGHYLDEAINACLTSSTADH
ncbi:hypothetical protein [Aeromonas tecta]|uniref:hypothetical protein n=1 Tax=Aeromonas tecta TaxID=324617 RepID=UPI000682AFF9|nr:hypothetical protein [Aeromonas tecta]